IRLLLLIFFIITFGCSNSPKKKQEKTELNSIQCTTNAWNEQKRSLLESCFGKISKDIFEYKAHSEPQITISIHPGKNSFTISSHTWNISYLEFKNSFGLKEWKIMKKEIWKSDILDIFEIHYNEKFKIAFSVLHFERPRIRNIIWGYTDLNKIRQ